MTTAHTFSDAFGSALRRTMRGCVASKTLPATLKLAWLGVAISLFKTGLLRSFRPSIESSYGFKLAGAPTDSNLNKIVFYRGLFEPGLSDVIQRLVRSGDTCVDAGANVGYFTLLMARQVGSTGKVFAIEASPSNAARLRANLALNNFSEWVEVEELACTDSVGSISFYVNESNDMHCRLELPSKAEADYWLMGKRWKAVTVDARPLTELVGGDPAKVSFIKLDIEGAEHRVTGSIVEYFTHPRLAVALEAKPPHIEKTLRPFEESGFFAYDLHNDYRWVVEQPYKGPSLVRFADLYKRKKMIDILLTRQILPGPPAGAP